MRERRRAARRAIPLIARGLRHLPGRVGGMGTYFAAQEDLARHGAQSSWREAVERLLRLSDRDHARGRISSALTWFDKALRITYDGALHQAGQSPLAADPEPVLRPLRSASIGTLLIDGTIDPAVRPTAPPPRDRAPGEPLRLLVLAQANWTFIHPVIEALRARGGIEIREIDVDELAAPGMPDRDHLLRARYDAITRGALLPTPPELAAAFDWADTVLVEWAHHVLTWVTLLDRAPRLLTARMHRFEVFTPFALLHDYPRIDRLLHVSPPVRRMLDAIAPQASAVPASQVGNLLQHGLGLEPAGERDPALLVQVGWLRPVKDVMFTLDVLSALREHAPAFQLRLIGPQLPDDPADDTPYQQQVRRRLADFPPAAIQVLGPRQDVPALLATSGIVLSSSRHEGTHEAVMEGLAAGCPAVVRDWPDTVPYGGARTIYSDEWVVPDAAAAVQRILALQDEQTYARAAQAARAFALQHRDPEQVIDGYTRALFPR